VQVDETIPTRALTGKLPIALPAGASCVSGGREARRATGKLELKGGASRCATTFHLFLATPAKARPWDRFKALDFDRVFAVGTNAVIIVVNTLDGVFHSTQLVEFSTLEHKGDFTIARTAGNIQRITPHDLIPGLGGSGLSDLGKNGLAPFFEVRSDGAKFFSHKIAILLWCLAPSSVVPRIEWRQMFHKENLTFANPPLSTTWHIETKKTRPRRLGFAERIEDISVNAVLNLCIYLTIFTVPMFFGRVQYYNNENVWCQWNASHCLDNPRKPLLQSAPAKIAVAYTIVLGAWEESLMATERKIRVLMAKPGLDGHDRGVKVLALALRDAGMEVIYSGLRQTPEQIVSAAIQEDVDVIGLSCLSGAHNSLFPRVAELLKERGANDILVIGGGIIPESDIPALKAQGTREIFGPGTPMAVITQYIQEHAPKRA
jgi:methylmalonyl-CoA mutase C-terminal domain/subunit